jgi:hypothetical protein
MVVDLTLFLQVWIQQQVGGLSYREQSLAVQCTSNTRRLHSRKQADGSSADCSKGQHALQPLRLLSVMLRAILPEYQQLQQHNP